MIIPVLYIVKHGQKFSIRAMNNIKFEREKREFQGEINLCADCSPFFFGLLHLFLFVVIEGLNDILYLFSIASRSTVSYCSDQTTCSSERRKYYTENVIICSLHSFFLSVDINTFCPKSNLINDAGERAHPCTSLSMPSYHSDTRTVSRHGGTTSI